MMLEGMMLEIKSMEEINLPQSEMYQIQHICECKHGDSKHDFFVKDGEKYRTNCKYEGCSCQQYKEDMYSPGL